MSGIECIVRLGTDVGALIVNRRSYKPFSSLRRTCVIAPAVMAVLQIAAARLRAHTQRRRSWGFVLFSTHCIGSWARNL